MSELLSIENLQVKFQLREGDVFALHDVTLPVEPGRILAVVGESGCGKSLTAKAALGLLPPRATITRGRILLYPGQGTGMPEDIAAMRPGSPALRALRGKRISMIFQEPMASFSPVHTIGEQIAEVVRLHEKLSARQVRERVIEILRMVSIPAPEIRMHSYPHQLSGGLRQRAMIAMALVCNPELVIADEPTTALDVTIQGQILNLLRELQQKLGMAIMLITHDMGVVAQIADDVAVMYLGRVVERNTVEGIFQNPRHPYTRSLLDSIPRLGLGKSQRLAAIPGTVPSVYATVPGCPFHTRCPYRIDGVCDRGAAPYMTRFDDGGLVACHLYTDGRSGISGAPAPDPDPQEALL